MMTDRTADSGASNAMFAGHVTDDATRDGAFAATRMGRSRDERKDDGGDGKFQFRVHDDFP